MLEFYGDVIVMRHFQKGAPAEAAKWSSVPIINGGDGWGEHPTQILTDLYTVLRVRGRIDGLKWVAVGDMRMRTMHSLGYALQPVRLPDHVRRPDAGCPLPRLARHAACPTSTRTTSTSTRSNYREAESVEQVIADADVILVEPVIQPDYTQARQEASKDHSLTPAAFKITRELLATKAKSDAILLHSLPRMDEIPLDVDITKWSRYWQEAFHGVVMRMALLALVLGARWNKTFEREDTQVTP